MSSFNLKKGQRFELSKAAPGLNVVKIGLGWNPNEKINGPLFDLDVSAFAIGENFKIISDSYFVYYGQVSAGNSAMDDNGNERPASSDGAILGAVDQQVGGDNDDEDEEDMFINLKKININVQQIIICATICKYPNDANKDKRTINLNFGEVTDCYIRIINENTGEELTRFDLKDSYTNEDAVEFGRLFRAGNSWEFEAMGRAHNGSLETLVEMYT